ncbi:4-hydroxythreonine-4-phosphate dehydrogenase PdxA [Ruegeria marisrubri]|uniref:4-hydroxythreonine-4-phosphate dehydrogenase PdxA n=1 Tax=Ruegeria marisrubri TaxID=1685379 RepID=UPI001CD5F981|nr:4-hydroxythreonine-4-phosphate dehydrogenase PdxA [Ruegeria marisrubri]MCA0904847.1 4-hydroxythreonine-4-phosphate dehydrogenase PdxA [Ruegeria marisrubri]
MTRPIALSCGEPAGIGPEIAAKAWAELRQTCPFFFIGDASHLPAGTPIAKIQTPSDAVAVCDQALPVLHLNFPAPNMPGQPDPANAPSVIDAIETGVDLVKAGAAAALCTAPIHKKALIDGAGFAYPGHTEFLAALSGTRRVVMMLASDQLRVVPATIHIPLAQVPAALTPDLLRETIEITARGLRDQFGIQHPRIAIAGLNPHAGESGKMGREELDWIAPMLADLNPEDATLTGPHPADTLFHAAARARYDAAIAMYHDQALIPIKTLDFDRGVNVTLGLPFIRTSPDHGTALDIAGKGIANPTSLIEALKLAQRMAQGS